MSTTSILRSPNEPAKPFNWADPSSRSTRPNLDAIADLEIQNPKSSSFNIAYGGARGGGKGQGKEDQEPVEFASDISLDLTDIETSGRLKNKAPIAPHTYLRMVPRTGRTVYVKNNVDVARSFKMLAMNVSQNKVARDFYLQKFHERPGMKRKRLKSERWRRRFKLGFKATISRVRELTAQGCAFNWAYEAQGSSGFIEYASNPKRAAEAAEVGGGVMSPLNPRRHRALDNDQLAVDAFARAQAFEERVSGLNQQLNTMQRVIDETMTKNKNLEDEIKAISEMARKHERHQAEPEIDSSGSQKPQQAVRKEEKIREDVEREYKMPGVQDQLKEVQIKIQNLSNDYAVQKGQFTKFVGSGPLEEWKTLASQSNRVLGKLDAMAQQAGSGIRDFLERYDRHLKVTAAEHLDTLQKRLESSLELWNKEMSQKREFEERILQEYSKGNQREIQQLKGDKLNKETALEQLRVEFANERRRLNDEYNNRLIVKSAEDSRLMEKQHRKQERLVNWHTRRELELARTYQERADEKNNQWQEKLASAQAENARLIQARMEERAEQLKESQKASDQIRDLTSDLENTKQELDKMVEQNEELERKGLDELDIENKNHLREIEQLRKANNDLREQSKEFDIKHQRSEEELIKYRNMLTEAFQDTQKLQKLQNADTTRLKEEFRRDKALLEEEHQKQARANKEKLENLEQQVESQRKSKNEQEAEHHKAFEEISRKWQKELENSFKQVSEVNANRYVHEAEIETLRREVNSERNTIQNLTSELERTKEAHQSTLDARKQLELSKQGVEKNLTDLRRALQGAENEKKSLGEQLGRLETRIQTRTKENESLGSNLKAAEAKLASKVKEASAASKEGEEGKQQLASLRNRLEQVQKLQNDLQGQIKQKDSQIEKLKSSLKQGNERKVTELTTQLNAKVKQLKEAESLHNAKIIEQTRSLNQKIKTIKTLESKLAEAQRDRIELEEAMKKALHREESKRILIFNEFQKLRKEIRVMCRIRPPNAEDGTALLEYKTSEGKFHSKPAGLEIISQRSRFGTTMQVPETTKHYNFDRVFEGQETNQDVWVEISQFVQSFVEGRQVTIFCYGQTATGKTYTMSNSDHAIDEEGDPILTNEGIMPRSKALIFEEVERRRQKGWSVAVRGCCYEVYVKEIRLLLPNNVVKTKTLDPTAPPWWHVRDPEYQSLNSVQDFDEMFDSAMESRTFAATTSNSNSSRSHFILYLEFETKSPTMRKANKGSLCLVDLAGSEDPHKASAYDPSTPRRPSGAGASEDAEKKRVREQRLKEGIAINQSLRVLKGSISKIRNPTAANGKPTLEGGDEESSTLAKLLGPCLGRDSMVLMFVMISLQADCLTETKATLESGKEIAEIKLSPKKPQPVNTDETATTEGRRHEAVNSPGLPRRPGPNTGSRIPKSQGWQRLLLVDALRVSSRLACRAMPITQPGRDTPDSRSSAAEA
ncbi:hypothetical protein O1611_g5698 [Lasiodiplodia mahajangana]|uniref:Uncharacterized protein n=1 Tax=Lasiodiplodia mahajangana TaxID=1108764 RepID=A0ACC2JKA0_9PEZI|nr:hypothetical protein O1611_g5698 [Lasiodiplodia mahajangana]